MVVLAILALIASIRYLGVFEGESVGVTRVTAKAFESNINVIHSKWVDQAESVEINEGVIEVTAEGWAKQLNENVEGCVTLWNKVLPEAPPIAIYNSSIHVKGWSVGGGPGLCYFINQDGEPFDDDATPYFSYIPHNGTVTLFNM
jgi:hypothetical protein